MKIIFLASISASLLLPTLVQAQTRVGGQAPDSFKMSFGYGLGIIIMILLAIGGIFLSKKINQWLDKYNDKLDEKSRQNRK